MTEPLKILDVQPKSLARRRFLAAATVLAGVAFAVLWFGHPEIDPRLVGRWEWSPDPTAGFPMQFDGDGSGQVTLTVGCCSFARSCRWTVEGDELRLYSTPQLGFLRVDDVREYLGELWTSRITSPQPSRRYRILERTGTELRLQPLWSDGSLSDEAVEVYRRAVEGPKKLIFHADTGGAMSEQAQIDSSGTSFRTARFRWLVVMVAALAMSGHLWSRQGRIDPRLTGSWDSAWKPSGSTSTLHHVHLHPNGSALLDYGFWCRRFEPSYRWSVRDNELRIETSQPINPFDGLWEFKLALANYRDRLLHSDDWLMRYEIVELTESSLRLRRINACEIGDETPLLEFIRD